VRDRGSEWRGRAREDGGREGAIGEERRREDGGSGPDLPRDYTTYLKDIALSTFDPKSMTFLAIAGTSA
jgi:hypothetical protein